MCKNEVKTAINIIHCFENVSSTNIPLNAGQQHKYSLRTLCQQHISNKLRREQWKQGKSLECFKCSFNAFTCSLVLWSGMKGAYLARLWEATVWPDLRLSKKENWQQIVQQNVVTAEHQHWMPVDFQSPLWHHTESQWLYKGYYYMGLGRL